MNNPSSWSGSAHLIGRGEGSRHWLRFLGRIRYQLLGAVLFGVLAAVDTRRTEEDDRVLDVLRAEAAQRLQIFGEDAKGAGFFAFEKVGVLICKRLRMHLSIIILTRVHT